MARKLGALTFAEAVGSWSVPALTSFAAVAPLRREKTQKRTF
jgi:hypothetical protein